MELFRILASEKEGNVEVVTDTCCGETAEVGIEFRRSGQKSGLGLTKSHWYVIFLSHMDNSMAIMIKTEKLKVIAKKYYDLNKIRNHGENIEEVLIPFQELINLANYNK